MMYGGGPAISRNKSLHLHILKKLICIDELELEPLSTRRVIDRLVNFHKAREGKLAVPVQTLLHPVHRHTRHSNRNNFIQIRANKNCYKYSFIPNTTRDWNNVPEHLSDITESNNFKKEIIKHYLKR